MNLVALRSPEFRLYFFGAVANVNALWISRIVIGWLAWDLTHSAQFVGIVAACSLLPTLFGGPFFGVLVDRSDIKRAAYATNLAMIACIAVLLALQIAGHVATFSLILISLAIGTVTAAHHPVRLSLAPRLVKAEDVSSVVALSALNFNLARLISPAIGGVLIDLTGTTTALLVTLVLFLPNLAVLFACTRANSPSTVASPLSLPWRKACDISVNGARLWLFWPQPQYSRLPCVVFSKCYRSSQMGPLTLGRLGLANSALQ